MAIKMGDDRSTENGEEPFCAEVVAGLRSAVEPGIPPGDNKPEKSG